MNQELYGRELTNVVRQITEAFIDVSREDGITLHEADVIDDSGSDKQCSKARTLDTDTNWQDIPDELIENSYSILSFLDDKGFRYYLPG